MMGGLSSTSQTSKDRSQTEAPSLAVAWELLSTVGPVTTQSPSILARWAAGGGLALAARGLVILGMT